MKLIFAEIWLFTNIKFPESQGSRMSHFIILLFLNPAKEIQSSNLKNDTIIISLKRRRIIALYNQHA